MSMLSETKTRIEQLLTATILKKLETYEPETIAKPFHHRLLGKDRYAMFSFIQSMNTTFGMSIWEQVGEIIANGAKQKAQRGYTLLGTINTEAEELISKIHFDLRKGNIEPNYKRQLVEIKKVIKRGNPVKDPDSMVDLFVLDVSGFENFFDITSVKPNMKEFASLKRKLLRWIGLRLSQDPSAQIYTRLAIPYNPYHPESYDRWTLRGLYDLDIEILVAEDFWNFLGQGNIYEELLDVFDATGKKLKKIIDGFFQRFR